MLAGSQDGWEIAHRAIWAPFDYKFVSWNKQGSPVYVLQMGPVLEEPEAYRFKGARKASDRCQDYFIGAYGSMNLRVMQSKQSPS